MDGFTRAGVVLGCGVYALVAKGEVVYVGRARRVAQRVAQHLYTWQRFVEGKGLASSGSVVIKFDDLWVYPCAWAELAAVEEAMIIKHAPRHNIRMNPGRDKATLIRTQRGELRNTKPVVLNIGGRMITINGPPPPRPTVYPGFQRRV